MVRLFGRPAPRVKLNAQQEWQEACRLGLQLHTFHDPVVAASDDLQKLGHPTHSLVMGTINAQARSADYLEQYGAICQPHFMYHFVAFVRALMVSSAGHLNRYVRKERAAQSDIQNLMSPA